MLLKKYHKEFLTPGVYLRDQWMVSGMVFKVEDSTGFWEKDCFMVKVTPLELNRKGNGLRKTIFTKIRSVILFSKDGSRGLDTKLLFKTEREAVKFLNRIRELNNY